MATTIARETHLSRELKRDKPSRRITPRDAFELALGKWLRGERIEIGPLAEELGVARATVFRWVGSRDLLLGEVIWSLARSLLNDAVSSAKGAGADYGADVARRLMTSVLASGELTQFIASDPEYALKVLTGKGSVVQSRFIGELTTLIRAQVQAGHLALVMPDEDMAYLIVRIVEACLYSDQIAGRKPNLDIACEAIRILLAARPSPKLSGKASGKARRSGPKSAKR